jgi:hypothetical protein
MIISASRRTDIPAFYSKWFIRRIRAGFCYTVNPYNPNQAARISLTPGDVEVIVFWTRNSQPLIPHLGELDKAGFRYYFLYTLLDYPALLEPRARSLHQKLDGFRQLADTVGAEKLVWRYDPIIFSNITDVAFHLNAFEKIAARLNRCTGRCIISILDLYGKVQRRLQRLRDRGFRLTDAEELDERVMELMPKLVQIASAYGIAVQSCAEEHDLLPYGISAGACIDGDLIEKITRSVKPRKKDTSQRSLCRCVESKDIGAYDTCPYGCTYCYAVSSGKKVLENRKRMQRDSPSLLP